MNRNFTTTIGIIVHIILEHQPTYKPIYLLKAKLMTTIKKLVDINKHRQTKNMNSVI
jgi:hypothetical protein